MADPVTNNYSLTLPTVGGDTGTWGGILNTTTFTPIDAALGANTAVTITSADVTLTTLQFQSAVFTITGTLTGNRNLIIPLSPNSTSLACGGKFVVANNSSGAYTVNVKTTSSNSGVGVQVPQGFAADLYCDGSNVYYGNGVGLPAYAQSVSSSPQGQLAGTAGSVNTNAELSFDYVNGALYVCTVTGTSSTATWAAVSGQPGFNMPQNLSLSAAVVSNVLTLSVLAANTGVAPVSGNPVIVPFRDVTLTAGDPVSVSVTSALSIATVVGASLGSVNSVPFRLWVAIFNNGGTPVLALINCSNATSIFSLNETGVASTTGMTSGATTAGVFYTPNGTSLTSKAFRIIGFLTYETALATAGTYNNSPDVLQIFGPGVKKPGDPVQVVTINSTVVTTTNSTVIGGAAIGPTLSITPASKANLVRVESNGFAYDGRGDAWLMWLVRGTTLIGSQNIYNPTQNFSTAIPYNLATLDKPASATSVSYGMNAATGTNLASVYVPCSSGATIQGLIQTGNTAQMILTEYMG
jgi:hypothetical protein